MELPRYSPYDRNREGWIDISKAAVAGTHCFLPDNERKKGAQFWFQIRPYAFSETVLPSSSVTVQLTSTTGYKATWVMWLRRFLGCLLICAQLFSEALIIMESHFIDPQTLPWNWGNILKAADNSRLPLLYPLFVCFLPAARCTKGPVKSHPLILHRGFSVSVSSYTIMN
jgi:hypothetical protein